MSIGSQIASLHATIGADTSGLTSGLSKADASLNKTAGIAQTAGAAIGVGLAVAGAAAAAGIGYAVKSAMEFEKTMSGVKAVSGATGAEMTSLTNLSLQLGKDTVFSAAEAGKGIEELVKGGVSIESIMGGAAKATLNLASAGGVDLASAAEIGANAMSMFGLKGQDMAMVSDQIAGAANASSLSVMDFKLSLSQVGAVASVAGQTFQDTATSIAVMGAAGIKGSDAGTSLKQMFLNLTPTSKAQKQVFDDLGITTKGLSNQFFTASGEVKSMGEIAGVLNTATKDLDEETKLFALSTMFGSDAMRAAAIVAKAGSEGFDTMAGSMSKVTAEAVAAEKLNNLTGDIEQAKGSAETFAITLGTSLTPELRTVTQAGTAFINDAIEKLPGTIEAARVKLADLQKGFEYYTGVVNDGSAASKDFDRFLKEHSGVLSGLAFVVGTVSTAVGLSTAMSLAHAIATEGLTIATGLLAIAQGGLNAVMALNPFVAVAALIIGLAAAFVTAYNTSDDFRRIVDAGMAGAQAAIGGMVSAAQSALGALGNALGAIGTAISNLMTAIGRVPSSVSTNVETTYSSRNSNDAGGGGSHDVGGSAYNAWVEGGSFDPTNSGAGWGYNAAGTDFWRGGPTWVGEQGPELLNLPRGSRITPNDRAMGGGATVVNNFYMNGTYLGDDRAMVQSLARVLKPELDRVVSGAA